MPMTIWKTKLVPTALQIISVPAGAEMLSASQQFEDICVWYRCDPNNKQEDRTIEIVGTGRRAPDSGRYLGTAQMQGGKLAFHVFERVA